MSDHLLTPTCSQCHTTVSSLWEKLKDGEIQCIKCYRLTSRRTLSVDLSRANLSLSQDSCSTNHSIANVFKTLIRRHNDGDVISKGIKSNDDVSSAADAGSDSRTLEDHSIRTENIQAENARTESAASVSEEKDVLSEQKSMIGRTATTRKSNRIKPLKAKSQNTAKALATKGRGRRIIFKRNPIKSSPSVTTVVTRDHIFYEGSYWQVGDIVSVLDVDDDEIYYAQLRGFLQDQYLEKSAVITWLIPTVPSDPQRFVSNDYVLGPDEEVPRKMACFEFICHAPSDYYRCLNAPYPTFSNQPELGFIWTRLGPKIEPIANIPDILSEENPTPQTLDEPKTILDKKDGSKKLKESGVRKQLTSKEKIKKV